MRNLEYKAELREPDIARAVLRQIGAVCHGSARQIDTYYRVPSGRLKRRQTDGCVPEVIYYTRPDDTAPTMSVYTRMTDTDARARFGEAPLPVRCVVAKTRELWRLGRTRIHLDEVDTLGWFVEFEREMDETEMNLDRAQGELRRLREHLAPALGEPLSRGYADLIET